MTDEIPANGLCFVCGMKSFHTQKELREHRESETHKINSQKDIKGDKKMTDETEEKILKLESLAKTAGKEKEFGSIPLEALVHLTAIPEMSSNELKYFIEGFFFGYKSNAFISPVVPIGE